MNRKYTYADLKHAEILNGLLAFTTLFYADRDEIQMLRNTIESYIDEDEDPELNVLFVAAIAVIDAELERGEMIEAELKKKRQQQREV
tara:strand:+ start:388 stop:651 length:264 start_codon:yes stop_codon:yes gene_type:complete